MIARSFLAWASCRAGLVRSVAAPLCLLGACATAPPPAVVNGVVVPRQTLEYTGRPFSVRHSAAHPQPGGPSSGLRADGGRISGQVCGMDVEYQVQHVGDHLQLVGFLDQAVPSEIQVRDRHGERVITGNLGNAGVELHLSPYGLEGNAGYRAFKLVQDGDRLIGKMRLLHTEVLDDVTINGRDALWGMWPADQGAVLPSLLSCFVAHIGSYGRSPLVVGFGGPAGALPRQSSSLYQP